VAFLAHPFILLSDNSDFLYNKFSNAVNKLEAAGEKHQAAATTFILGTPKAAKKKTSCKAFSTSTGKPLTFRIKACVKLLPP
jgi:hypothetical protein